MRPLLLPQPALPPPRQLKESVQPTEADIRERQLHAQCASTWRPPRMAPQPWRRNAIRAQAGTNIATSTGLSGKCKKSTQTSGGKTVKMTIYCSDSDIAGGVKPSGVTCTTYSGASAMTTVSLVSVVTMLVAMFH